MKKLMMFLAVVTTVGLAQAASVDWAINYGKDQGAGKTYYVFSGTASATVLAELSAVTSESATKLGNLAYATGTLNAKAGKASGDALDVGSDTSLFMVVLNSDLSAGATYTTATVDISNSVYTPPASSPGAYTAAASAFTGSGTIAAGGGGGGGDIPEPTSGLLLLVGAGMLALRRKQK